MARQHGGTVAELQRHEPEQTPLNDQQLTQVLNGMDEATTFAPGESSQLLPPLTPQAKAVQTHDNIIDSATRLAADMVAIYQGRVDEAQRKLASVQEIAQRLVAAATKTAEEVDRLNRRDCAVGEGFARVLAENGIEFEGAI